MRHLRGRAARGVPPHARPVLQYRLRARALRHRHTGRARAGATAADAAHLDDGTDPASLELIRVTVTERQRLIAEGRFVDEFITAYRDHLIAHKEPVTTSTVTWFSPRASGPRMRLWDDEELWFEETANDAA